MTTILTLCLLYIVLWFISIIAASIIWKFVQPFDSCPVVDYIERGTIAGKFLKSTTYITFGLFIIAPIIILALIFNW